MSKFKEAFAKARKAGKKVFTFGGKKFTTETKDDVKKTAAKSASRLKQSPRKTKPKANNIKKSGMTNGDTKKESPKPVKAKGTTSKSKMTNGDTKKEMSKASKPKAASKAKAKASTSKPKIPPQARKDLRQPTSLRDSWKKHHRNKKGR